MRLDVNAIFRARFQEFTKEFIRYSQYMANGGVLFIALFLSGLIAVYYRELIAAIPAWFPISLFLALVVAIVVARSPHRTFLQQADLLFLTTVESKMESYFQRSQVYNYVVQSAGLFLILLVLLPLYVEKIHVDEGQLWFYWIVPFILKGWNINSSWIVLTLPDRKSLIYHTVARYLLTFFILAWMFSGGALFSYHNIQFGGFACAIAIVLFHLRLNRIKREHSYQWYRLLEMENGLRRKFYRFVNQFTDIPHLQNQGKRRSWLTHLVRFVPYRRSNSARILFLNMFIRSGDYAGVYFRLLLLGGLLVVIFPNIYVKAIAAVLVLLMTGSQVKGLWKRQRKGVWYSIFPIPDEVQKRSFVWVCWVLLLVQGIILSICVLPASPGAAAIVVVSAVITSYLYSFMSLPKGLK